MERNNKNKLNKDCSKTVRNSLFELFNNLPFAIFGDRKEKFARFSLGVLDSSKSEYVC